MDGLDKITGRIAADAQAQAEAIVADAQARSGEIAAQAQAQARAEAEAIRAKAEAACAQRRERIASMAQLEGRKRLLAAKQEGILAAFDRALEDLIALPEDKQIELLAAMAAQAAVTGRERVMLNAEDQKKIGKAVVARANELLAKAVAPKLPEELKGSTAGAILDKAVTTVTALAKGTAMLTLAEEARPICGGLILESEGVEINCAYETLVRLSRPQLEREVAGILFGQ